MPTKNQTEPKDRNHAMEMQDLGVGWIELTDDNGWKWHWGARPADAAVVARNQPTPEGREAGAVLAKRCDEMEARLRAVVGPTPERCSDCAARAGTYPNGCMATLVDFAMTLVSGEPFFCHAGIDLVGDQKQDPKLICRGWIAMARPEDVARVAEFIAAGEAKV